MIRIETQSCEILCIHDATHLDPITVVLQDLGPNRGRIIVECYGTAWAAGWGSMGGTIREFMCRINSGYLATKLTPGDRRQLKRDEKYLQRIADAVIEAFQGQDKESK